MAESASARIGGQLLVIEGYDGSGKSTLIEALHRRLPSRSIRVIGRKSEPELRDIAAILERDDIRPDPRAEMHLRIAVEVERMALVTRALASHEVVVCDRGVISLVAWFGYLNVLQESFAPSINEIKHHYREAITLICQADFDTCWSRSSRRPAQSRKDRLGKEVNRGYFVQYDAAVHSHLESEDNNVVINTVALDVASSVDVVLGVLKPNLKPSSRGN